MGYPHTSDSPQNMSYTSLPHTYEREEKSYQRDVEEEGWVNTAPRTTFSDHRPISQSYANKFEGQYSQVDADSSYVPGISQISTKNQDSQYEGEDKSMHPTPFGLSYK